jgi:hypothetical protein
LNTLGAQLIRLLVQAGGLQDVACGGESFILRLRQVLRDRRFEALHITGRGSRQRIATAT